MMSAVRFAAVMTVCLVGALCCGGRAGAATLTLHIQGDQ